MISAVPLLESAHLGVNPVTSHAGPEAVTKYGTPEIMNTDQGSQFTSSEFVGMLERHLIAISMDGKGCWRDNVFVERLWKTIKYEHVYLHAYATVSEAKAKLAAYLGFYNGRRPHTALDRQTPDTAYFNRQPWRRLPELQQVKALPAIDEKLASFERRRCRGTQNMPKTSSARSETFNKNDRRQRIGVGAPG